MRKLWMFLILLFGSAAVLAVEHNIACSYAPSQSRASSAVAGGAAAMAASTSALLSATGLTAVAHSSGALIFTGASGYVAGTIRGAAAAPIAVGVGLVVAGTAMTVELVFAPINRPESLAKVEAAARAFWSKVSQASPSIKDWLLSTWDRIRGSAVRMIAWFDERTSGVKPKDLSVVKIELLNIQGDVFAWADRTMGDGK